MRFAIISLLTLVALPVCAEVFPAYEVKPDGTYNEILLGANDADITELSVFSPSAGNISNAWEVFIEGPIGLKYTAQFAKAPSVGALNSFVDAKTNLQPLKLKGQKKERQQGIITVTNGDNDERIGSEYAILHLQKDTCSGKKTDRYVLKVTIDLSGVDKSFYAEPFLLRVALKEYKYKGDMVASIKPESDGKYKGEPILLMSSIGSSEYVNIVGWKNGKIKSSKRIPIVKYVSYKGYGLSLARLKGHLNGGKFTFELSNGGDIYGVCFAASQKRQVANGYPL